MKNFVRKLETKVQEARRLPVGSLQNATPDCIGSVTGTIDNLRNHHVRLDACDGIEFNFALLAGPSMESSLVGLLCFFVHASLGFDGAARQGSS